jgi:hypothetical protein
LSDKRYYPGYMNEEEHAREQMRQKDMVESIARRYSRQEKEKALERLSQSLEALERIAKDLMETTKVLKNSSSLLSHG